MASSSSIPIPFLLCFFLCLTFFPSESKTTLKPNQFVLPVRKWAGTGLHVTYVHKRTPSQQLPLALDLNAHSLWVNCDKSYHSSTYQAPPCRSTQCSRAGAFSCITCPDDATGPGCHKNSCGVIINNPVTHVEVMSELAQDALSIQSTKGSNPGPMFTIPSFLFVCPRPTYLQKGMPKNVAGVAGLGHSPLGLPTQLASHFGFPPKFAVCLSPSTSQSGVVFFGEGPYTMNPGVDLAATAISSSTPLTVTPTRGEYHVGLKSIRINNKEVPLNKTLLSIAGTKLSTTSPYSVLEHSIYGAVSRGFAAEMAAAGLKQVRAVAPFTVCYEGSKVGSTRAGTRAPVVDLVMEKQNAPWRLVGANTMVEAKKGVKCLAVVDGGSAEKMGGVAVVVGAKQMEDNLVVFDLAKSRVGFSSWLPGHGTSCASFNFAHTATATADADAAP